ncbi:MAG: hypothetical protein OXH97_09380 [Chloroflexota bacterium]|nr:hypothetical protein [Chloroflexota bacterium]
MTTRVLVRRIASLTVGIAVWIAAVTLTPGPLLAGLAVGSVFLFVVGPWVYNRLFDDELPRDGTHLTGRRGPLVSIAVMLISAAVAAVYYWLFIG